MASRPIAGTILRRKRVAGCFDGSSIGYRTGKGDFTGKAAVAGAWR